MRKVAVNTLAHNPLKMVAKSVRRMSACYSCHWFSQRSAGHFCSSLSTGVNEQNEKEGTAQ